MKTIPPLICLFFIFNLLVACNDEKRDPDQLTFEDAYKELLILGVEVKVDFDSFENIKIADQIQEVPCVKIQSYQFFAITETPKFISDIIKAINNFKKAIKKEIGNEEYGFCLSEGFSFTEIISELEDCKQMIEDGGVCF